MFSEYEESLEWFLQKLSTSDPNQFTDSDWDLIHAYTRSDGCTGVIDFYIRACIEHDFYFRTHHDFEGRLISFTEANMRFMRRIQKLSKFGIFSPLAIERWLGVTLLPQSHKAWEGKMSCH